MRAKKKVNKLFIPIIAFVMMITVFLPIGTQNVAYAASDSSLIESAEFFLSLQYEKAEISADTTEVVSVTPLYDEANTLVAKAVVVQRDSTFDYVVFNDITSEVVEFGLDSATALDTFVSDSKIYYTGTLDYFSLENNSTYVSRNGDRRIPR
jgi:hypothetical protein